MSKIHGVVIYTYHVENIFNNFGKMRFPLKSVETFLFISIFYVCLKVIKDAYHNFCYYIFSFVTMTVCLLWKFFQFGANLPIFPNKYFSNQKLFICCEKCIIIMLYLAVFQIFQGYILICMTKNTELIFL